MKEKTKTGEKQRIKKGKEGPKEVVFTPETGPEIVFLTSEMLREIVTKLRPKKKSDVEHATKRKRKKEMKFVKRIKLCFAPLLSLPLLVGGSQKKREKQKEKKRGKKERKTFTFFSLLLFFFLFWSPPSSPSWLGRLPPPSWLGRSSFVFLVGTSPFSFVMNAKIDPKVVVDLSHVLNWWMERLQPINRKLLEEFIDENEL